MRQVLLLALLAMLPACGPGELPTKYHQAEAVTIVWSEFLGESGPAPEIDWVEGERLNCCDGYGFEFTWNGKTDCVGGLFWHEIWLVQIAWWEGLKLSDSALAHEFCHAHSYLKTKDADGNHAGSCFVKDGLVDQANQKLRVRGL